MAETDFLTPTASAASALAALADPVRQWFQQCFGEPTAIQRAAWPAIAAGRHVLVSAPTGTGKTLAAFLPPLSRLISETPSPSPWQCGPRLTGIYVSPLKALANDACRNLTRHLEEIATLLPPEARPLRCAVRTGDTPPDERRNQIDDPPDVLLTTPESLAVLLSQPDRQDLFADLRFVVVDEIHALAGSKRGADVAVSLERLATLSANPVQRLGLSATATPLEKAARFLAGQRPCSIAVAHDTTALQLQIAPLERTTTFVAHLATRIEPELRANRATLIFTNTRGLAERLAWSLRRRMPDWDERIAVHHSSISADRRLEVEQRFKAGQLGAVVSSTSLELGIDIGTVDLVVLVHPPGDVVRLLQRVGRAGHGPGRARRGLVLTESPAELLEAAVTAASGRAGQCEPLDVSAQPLDVLCQQLLGMACASACSADETFDLVRGAYPFRDLSRADFDDCLAYLFGRDRDGADWLPPRLAGDLQAFTVRDEGTARVLRRNLGTILAEDTATVVRDSESASNSEFQTPNGSMNSERIVGTVDLAFAERLQAGDRFLLDGRCLQVGQVTGNEVHVEEVTGRPAVPRWGGDGWPLSPELARRLFSLRVQAAEALRDGPVALAELLRRDYGLEGRAVEVLAGFFQEQEAVSEIPDDHVCLVEAVASGSSETYHVHTPLNRTANDALARVAVRRLVRDLGRSALSIVADLGFALVPRGGPLAPPDADIPALFRRLLDATGFAFDLDGALADGDLIRSRFNRVAVTGLMVLRHPAGRKRRVGGKDWADRRLFEQIKTRDPDFVLLRQTLREVRSTACDGAAALDFVRNLPALAVRCRWLARPSPFTSAWTQEAIGAIESVETPAQALERLHAELFRKKAVAG